DPCAAMPITASPAFQFVTPAPTASITPARSLPAICFVPGAARSAIFQSTGFTDTARTLTRTCPGPGSGMGTDSTFTLPSLMTAACSVLAAEACAPANASAPTVSNEHILPIFMTTPFVSGRLRGDRPCHTRTHLHGRRFFEEEAQHTADGSAGRHHQDG